MKRISWNTLWLKMATFVSFRSADEKMRVGCIVVSSDNTKILSLGYNGDHMGGPNVRDSIESGNSGFIHAEVNALIKLDFSSHLEKIMYVTHSPCEMCAKAIINAGIKKVYYNELYSEKGLKLLQSSNIDIEKIEPGE